MVKITIICLVLFSLVCASYQQGCGNSRGASDGSSDSHHPYSYTYDWFHRSKLNEVVGEPPRRKLVVYYYGMNNGESMKVNLGNRFDPEEVRYQPYVWWRGEPSKLYTLMLVDADGAEKEKQTFRHWMIINIEGNNVNTGDSISDYLGAGPPKSTGDHRYAFLVYEQKHRIEADSFPIASSRSTKGREDFNVKKFAKKYGLGTPLVANYFVAKYQKGYVEKFYERFED